jgi:hypothetical protein
MTDPGNIVDIFNDDLDSAAKAQKRAKWAADSEALRQLKLHIPAVKRPLNSFMAFRSKVLIPG